MTFGQKVPLSGDSVSFAGDFVPLTGDCPQLRRFGPRSNFWRSKTTEMGDFSLPWSSQRTASLWRHSWRGVVERRGLGAGQRRRDGVAAVGRRMPLVQRGGSECKVQGPTQPPDRGGPGSCVAEGEGKAAELGGGVRPAGDDG